MPGAASVRKQAPPKLVPRLRQPRGFGYRPYAFDTSSVVPLRSSSCPSPDLVLSRPFPPVLTTMAFDHSRRRWFGTYSCKPVPRGLPSSVKQLHTLGPPRPFALVAHYRPHIARSEGRAALTPGPVRRVRCSTARVTEVRLAASLRLSDLPARLPSLRLAERRGSASTTSCRSPALRSLRSVCRD